MIDQPDTEFDVICIGGGLGGLAAAICATDHGLTVLVLERSAFVGGGAAYSGGLCWVPGLEESDPPDTLEAAEAYLGYVQGNRTYDPDLRRSTLQASRDAVRYFRDAGIPLEVVPGNPDVYFPNAPGSTASGRMLECAVDGHSLVEWRGRLLPSPHYRIGLRHGELFDGTRTPNEIAAMFTERQRDDLLTMGPGLAGAFVRAALVDREVTCLTQHRATQLVAQGTRITGVEALGPKGVATFTARLGVLISTGGYGWSPGASDLEGLPDFVEAGPPSISGDHLGLAESAGAGIVRGGGPQFSMGAHISPDDKHPGTDVPLCTQLFDVMGMPHNLVVNQSGRRFGDESYYVGINEALKHWDAVNKRWENFPCYLILDDQFRRSYRLGSLPAGATYPSHIVRADDMGSLAEQINVDPPTLCATVERFNAHAERGEDLDFGRGALQFVRRRYGDLSHAPNANLGTVSEPPFYALPLRLLGTGMCTFGLQTDEAGRVLRRDGTRVAGLYATGNAAATTEFRGYVTGYANTRNMAMAYQAANAMSAESLQACGRQEGGNCDKP